MKKIYRNIIAVVFAVAAIGCSDENLLDKNPYNSVPETAAFDSPENIALSVNGMYEAAAIGSYAGSGGRGYLWGAAYIEQNDCRGEDVVNTASFYRITYQTDYDATTANNMYYWHDGYNLINKANIVIEGVTQAMADGIISETEGKDIIGQARFLRGITHFELNVQMARPYNHTPDASHLGIILRDYAINDDASLEQGELDGARATVDQVYKHVLDDLKYAEDNASNGSVVYASSNAATAFKTRVYQHMGKWDEIINLVGDIEGKYTLTPSPSGVFDDNHGNSESIFSINQTAQANAGVNGALGSQYGRRLLVAISPIIWNNAGWLADDKRRAYGSDTDLVREVDGSLYTNKYRDHSTYSDLTPIIRHAEVKLNIAEAYAREDNLTEALSRLNEVRDRALADPTTQSYQLSDFPSKKELLEAIILERRIEFLMEGKRWGDIHRLQGDEFVPVSGIPAKVANGVPAPNLYDAASGTMPPLGESAVPYADYRFIWPIPMSETSVNPNAEQNPGY